MFFLVQELIIMSFTKSIISWGFLPSLHIKPSRRSENQISLKSSSNVTNVNNLDQILCWSSQKDGKIRRRFIVRSAVQPGVPPPSEPPSNFINWILGFAVTVVLPFFSNKWASLLKLKNEVETAVEAVEGIVDAVEKVAEGVEKVAEDIAEELPEGGGLRKAIDFVEHVAERANRDAHLVGDFIDKVQEVDEKVEEYVESLAHEASTHMHPKEEDIAHEPPKEEKEEEEEEDKEEAAHKPPVDENSDDTNIIR